MIFLGRRIEKKQRVVLSYSHKNMEAKGSTKNSAMLS